MAVGRYSHISATVVAASQQISSAFACIAFWPRGHDGQMQKLSKLAVGGMLPKLAAKCTERER